MTFDNLALVLAIACVTARLLDRPWVSNLCRVPGNPGLDRRRMDQSSSPVRSRGRGEAGGPHGVPTGPAALTFAAARSSRSK